MFRLTIRDVIWLIIVVTLGLTYVRDRQESARDQIELTNLNREKEQLLRVHQANFARDAFRGQLLTRSQGDTVRQRYKKWKKTGIFDTDKAATVFDP